MVRPGGAVDRARSAVAVVFAAHGVAVAAFISRMPAVRDDLALSTSQLGLLLLCCSLGSVAGTPLSALVVQRIGPGRGAVVGAVVTGSGLALLAVGLLSAAIGPAAVGLTLTGGGNAVWGVAMNVQGADVERELGRPIMPGLHAAFSLGTVGGAGTGVVCATLDISLGVQLLSIAALICAAVVHAVRHFLPWVAPAPTEKHRGRGLAAAWRERRTLSLGLLVLAFAFIEGAANDWLAVAIVDGYTVDDTLGALAFGIFVAAMTLGRMAGAAALQRFGRVVVLRAGATVALAGLLLVLLGGSVSAALAGAVLWGIGTSLGFPVAMSAAADDPVHAAARISVVNSFATALVAAPPLVGLLAEQVGILRALLVGIAALALAVLAAGAARPLGPAHGGAPRDRMPGAGEVPGARR
jgi:hypothetical protein